jgi:uncharacterized cupin superfamily protein
MSQESPHLLRADEIERDTHSFRHPFNPKLVYLSGGGHHAFEVADFPDHGKRMVRVGEIVTFYEADEGQPFEVGE